MKKLITLSPALLIIAVLLTSCATNKQALEIRKAEIQNSKEVSNVIFVKYTDGTIKHFQSLKLVKGAFKTPHLLANKKITILPEEILAYQNADHYAISQSLFVNGRKSYLAKETLPGFAVRIAKGKLNIYCKKFYNGTVAVDEYFLQCGNDGQIYSYTPDLMKQMIMDNYEAMAAFDCQENASDVAQKLKATAEVYNNTLLMSKN